MTPLERLNTCSSQEAHEAFFRCCGSKRWAERMTQSRPFADESALLIAARNIGSQLTAADWQEAFTGHPKIGDVEGLRKKFASTASLSEAEQAGALGAEEATLLALADGNRRYEAKFGFIFIVCATGKTAEEMLRLLQERLPNDPVQELSIAAGEQEKITALRLRKLCT